MKTRIKIGICAALALWAALLSGRVIGSFGLAEAAREKADYSRVTGGYVVGAYDGCVAVYMGEGQPQTVTDIALTSLRETDRLSVEEGIEVESYEALLQLLEDYGS